MTTPASNAVEVRQPQLTPSQPSDSSQSTPSVPTVNDLSLDALSLNPKNTPMQQQTIDDPASNSPQLKKVIQESRRSSAPSTAQSVPAEAPRAGPPFQPQEGYQPYPPGQMPLQRPPPPEILPQHMPPAPAPHSTPMMASAPAPVPYSVPMGPPPPPPPQWGNPYYPQQQQPGSYYPEQQPFYPQPGMYPPYPETAYPGPYPPNGRPPPPPPQQQQFMSPQANPWRLSYQAGLAADSAAYMPDSSLLAAVHAGRRPPKQNQFPPPTKENLQMFRDNAKSSNDPQVKLDLAKYLLEAIPQIMEKEPDPKRARKAQETLTAEAQKIVKKLASSSSIGKTGYAEAQFFLGNAYGTGSLGLEKDIDKAFGYYLQGAKQNHAACNYRVAVCYELGAGTKKDKAHAIQYYRKAANLGDPSAMYKLGLILLKGLLNQTKNPREGISWLKRATQHPDQPHPHAFHELGLAYEKEGIASVIPDIDYARELFTQAAQLGYAPSQFKLGLAYENGFLNCPIDPRRSIAWYSKAAEQGHLEAELALSGWYLTGAEGILKQSDSEAYLWARRAADKGYAKAEYAVAYYTETGIGVRQNLDEAKKWYMRAAAQNNKRAMQRLTELKRSGAGQPKQRRKHTRQPDGKPDSKDGDCVIM